MATFLRNGWQLSPEYALDIEVDGNMTVEKGHAIAAAVEERICQTVRNVYDIIIHVEPMGNVENNEKYGRSAGE